ncbi:N-6 DNA methylase (plasmid) [Macrococcoides caseolyticum]|uniref:HsdM family class I SAM-dependent methyltransferase n=1 Tax=Macrococcoides caseolyticum TaxID=69966 RepID=UPI000CD07B38|nr:N-6 DNA methylase [Macrococcus caseolyticus]PNZ74214.1 SAM-dependent methyltransferase [Macrococcus caseolyticus]QPT47863.1 N-6 DNA methylase [Macrococcus caseolyticus]
MLRTDIKTKIGRKYITTNIENDEFSYPKAFKEKGLNFNGIKVNKTEAKYLDIRAEYNDFSVLIETKQDFYSNLDVAKEQLSAYVAYEKSLTGNNVIAILANTNDDSILVWKDDVSDKNLIKDEYILKTFEEYAEYFTNKTNNKEEIMRNTYILNEMLHEFGIREKLRSQFVGTCLLTLKNSKVDLIDKDMNNSMIRAQMENILGILLQNDLHRANKISLLAKNVLESQDIRQLDDNSFRKILTFISEEILPYINDKSIAGQDLLNLFFVTFNKYVGKEDKNQAFTPDHITDFMSKLTEINRHSRVLDPCCGSGSFLVRALTQSLNDCSTEDEQKIVKKNQIYGIEYDENIYGLATTNMLIHGDGNSNIYQSSCFDYLSEIEKWNIDTVLMNPPYNATKSSMPKEYTSTWTSKQKQDPSKGFYFVKEIIKSVKKGKLAVLLPMSCAIGNTKEIKKIKEELLRENTLEAVFSLPDEIFYPGASSVACCMLFTLGKRHDSSKPTFFGYYKNDGFIKKKNLGRVEKIDEKGIGAWNDIENEWLDLYFHRKEVIGLSTLKCVSGSDEWLAEAYMETDYSNLSNEDFQQTINDYLAYLISTGEVYES